MEFTPKLKEEIIDKREQIKLFYSLIPQHN